VTGAGATAVEDAEVEAVDVAAACFFDGGAVLEAATRGFFLEARTGDVISSRSITGADVDPWDFPAGTGAGASGFPDPGLAVAEREVGSRIGEVGGAEKGRAMGTGLCDVEVTGDSVALAFPPAFAADT
jgi:hypothetical protein